MNTHITKYLTQKTPDQIDPAALAFLASLDHLENTAPNVKRQIIQELKDQRSQLKLIASENYSSLSVQLAMGNLLTDKYAEGFPHHRFYPGCANVDAIESDAVETAKKLFNAEAAYVQPHSGCDANLVAFFAILFKHVYYPEMQRLGKKNPTSLTRDEHEKIRLLMHNQKMLGMSLNSGGHLSHGYRLNMSSKIMESICYDVDPKTEMLDYAKLEEQAKREKPLILLAGYSAYPRKINCAKLREIADRCNAVLMIDMAHFAGLVAGHVFQGEYDPVPYADIITTTTHKTLRGPRGGLILCKKEYEDMVNKGCPFVLGGPLPHVIAAKTIAFQEAQKPDFQTYTKRIVKNAKAMAERFLEHGARLITGGTDNHLLLIDTTTFGLTGHQAEKALRKAYITVNRNAIPYDKNGVWYTSGIRLGTPAMTTLGMGQDEAKTLADLVVETLTHTKPAMTQDGPCKSGFVIDTNHLEKIRGNVRDILSQFPLYPEIIID